MPQCIGVQEVKQGHQGLKLRTMVWRETLAFYLFNFHICALNDSIVGPVPRFQRLL